MRCAPLDCLFKAIITPEELGATNERRRAEDAKSSSGIRLGSKLPVSFWAVCTGEDLIGISPGAAQGARHVLDLAWVAVSQEPPMVGGP